jgi:hypothetical protein
MLQAACDALRLRLQLLQQQQQGQGNRRVWRLASEPLPIAY